MIKSVWFQRFLAICDALVLGIIIDRFTHSPLYGAAGFVGSSIIALYILSRTGVIKKFSILDDETIAVLSSTVLSLVFFIECAIAAWLIVS